MVQHLSVSLSSGRHGGGSTSYKPSTSMAPAFPFPRHFQSRRLAVIVLLAPLAVLVSPVVSLSLSLSTGSWSSPEDPVKKFVLGAYNKVDFDKGLKSNVAKVIEFGMDEAGLGPFAGLLVGALGLPYHKIPPWVNNLEGKMADIQKGIETLEKDGRFDRQEELKAMVQKFRIHAGSVVHLYSSVTKPDTVTYRGFRTDNASWADGEMLQNQVTAAFQSTEKLSQLAVSVVYQSIQRYDVKYVPVQSMDLTITQNLKYLTNSVEQGDHVASMQTWRENFHGLVSHLARLTCSECGGPADFFNSPSEILRYREAMNEIYKLYKTVLAIKKQAAIMWLLMQHNYSEKVGNTGKNGFFQNITLGNVEQAFSEEFENAHAVYKANFQMIGKGFVGANRVTYCNLMGPETALTRNGALHGSTTIDAGKVWSLKIPETVTTGTHMGNIETSTRSEMDASFEFDTPVAVGKFEKLEAGKCVSFGSDVMKTFDDAQVFGISHRDRYVWSGGRSPQAGADPQSSKTQDVTFDIRAAPTDREVVVALTDCKIVRADSQALDYVSGPGMQCSGKTYSGDFGALESDSVALRKSEKTSWMYDAVNGSEFASVVNQIRSLSADEARKSADFTKAHLIASDGATGASDGASKLETVTCFIDPVESGEASISNCS